jgi:indole-3-glycerol phosphate synthase
MAMFGARSFLIGESLMRQPDVEQATRDLLANPLTAGGM